MISIADIGIAIEAARTYALPGRSQAEIVDVYWHLRELTNDQAKYSFF
jgi:hypothetical protein